MFGIKISLPRLGALLQVADAEFEMPYIYESSIKDPVLKDIVQICRGIQYWVAANCQLSLVEE